MSLLAPNDPGKTATCNSVIMHIALITGLRTVEVKKFINSGRVTVDGVAIDLSGGAREYTGQAITLNNKGACHDPRLGENLQSS